MAGCERDQQLRLVLETTDMYTRRRSAAHTCHVRAVSSDHFDRKKVHWRRARCSVLLPSGCVPCADMNDMRVCDVGCVRGMDGFGVEVERARRSARAEVCAGSSHSIAVEASLWASLHRQGERRAVASLLRGFDVSRSERCDEFWRGAGGRKAVCVFVGANRSNQSREKGRHIGTLQYTCMSHRRGINRGRARREREREQRRRRANTTTAAFLLK